MRYLDVCTGISAPTVAWRPLGFEPVAYSEIAAFPCAVLQHHYPKTENWGDMRLYKKWAKRERIPAIDLVIGGTPCQSYSIAGLRDGLADPRGELTLTYLALLQRYKPRWFIWENVPGVLSQDGGRAFGTLLRGVEQLGYGYAWRTLDAQYFNLAQRRHRVFLVGCLGDFRRAAAVLLEREGMRGDPAPSRKARETVAGTVGTESSSGRSYGSRPIPDNLIAFGGNDTRGPRDTAAALLASDKAHYDFETETLLVAGTLQAHHSVRADQAWQDQLVPVAFDTTQITNPDNRSAPRPGGPCHPLAASAHAPTIAFNSKQDPDSYRDHTGALSARHDQDQAVLIQTRGSNVSVGEISGTLGTNADRASGSAPMLLEGLRVRRLMPIECERLQGFPDNYTAITYKGKPAKDSPRYVALGNSMPTHVIQWLGRRIQLVDGIRRTA